MKNTSTKVSLRIDIDKAQRSLERAIERLDIFILKQKIHKFKQENVPPQHWRD